MSDICTHGIERAEVVEVGRDEDGFANSAYIHVPVDPFRLAFFDACGSRVTFTGAADENGDEMALDSGAVSDLSMQALDAWEAFRNADDGERESVCECDCRGRNRYCPCTPRGLGCEL